MPPSIVGNWGSIVVYCKLELARCGGGLIGAAWCPHVLCAQWGEGSADCRGRGLERIQITTSTSTKIRTKGRATCSRTDSFELSGEMLSRCFT